MRRIKMSFLAIEKCQTLYLIHMPLSKINSDYKNFKSKFESKEKKLWEGHDIFSGKNLFIIVINNTFLFTF